MEKGRFTEAQIIAILRQAEGGIPIPDHRNLLRLAIDVRGDGRLFGHRDEVHPGREQAPEEDVL
jgi:hypothetical protein